MNRLTTEMRRQWEDDGYLHLKNMIPADEVSEYLDAATDYSKPKDQLEVILGEP